MRRPRRRQRRHLLQLRPPQSRHSGDLPPRCARSATTWASCRSSSARARHLRAHADRLGPGHLGMPGCSLPRPKPSSFSSSAAAAPHPVFAIGPLVDGAERRVAARGHPPHPLQHDGGAAARAGGGGMYGPGRMVIIYSPPDSVGFSLSSLPGAPARQCLHRWQPVHGRRVGVDRRPHRRASRIRQRTGSTHGPEHAPQSYIMMLVVRIHPARHRQLRARRRLGRRLPRGAAARPAKPERGDHIDSGHCVSCPSLSCRWRCRYCRSQCCSFAVKT